MTKKVLLISFLLIGFFAHAQITSVDFRSKTFLLVKDTIQIDTVSINSQKFKVLTAKKKLIKSSEYQIDFSKALLIINSKKYPKISVEYFRFPDFITKTYSVFDERILVPDMSNTKKLYSLTSNKKRSKIDLFEGLNTNGNITRGITIGNNQNSVVNATLDLNIEGKLSKDIALRAHIYDTNIPLQDNGYSQSITDFDRIFMELTSKKWRVKAGDLDLKNKESYFFQLTKKVAGLEVEVDINDQTSVLASGAIVKGRFSEFEFMGKEGNQGPYRIFGPEQESYIIIIAGSDALYANGVALQRGENNDYTIDYNTAEIRFNTTFPITNDMRFHIKYQYSDRNYTRFVTYEKASYNGEKISVNGFFYNENDAKDQPVQQSLTDAQKQILAAAGNDISKMIAQSAYKDVYSDSKILYKKLTAGATETFEYSNNSTDELYNVHFTFVGPNKGDYLLEKTIAIGNVFKFTGTNLGSYSPIVRLAAPSKSQIAVVNATYTPSKKTTLFTEIALSNNDLNLFSSIDDSQNKGMATKLNWKQLFFDNEWKFSTDLDYEFVHQNFNTEQNFESIEYKRDWNLVNPLGNKQLLSTRLILQKKKNSIAKYRFQFLEYSKNYTGIKHHFNSSMQLKNTVFSVDGSLLNSSSSVEKNYFLRAKAAIEHRFTKKWIGGLFNLETNKRTAKNTLALNLLSYRFKEVDTYIGFGDSTKVFAKIGVKYRENDSIKRGVFTQTNRRKTIYLNSKIIQNTNSNLTVYANYRTTKNSFANNEQSLNSKIVYSQKLFKNFIHLHTVYETSSGNIPRQEYVYIKTEPGQGYYTWIDYNNNGIKEFNEFEIAKFKDEAEYLRVALPNINYINTQRAKWVQSIVINPSQWARTSGFKKVISHLYNQTYFLIDNEQKRTTNAFNWNPFDIDESNLLGLNFSLRNSLFFNKNLQNYSVTYTYGRSKNKQLYSIGNQENTTYLHQLELQHKLGKFWLMDFKSSRSKNKVMTENFANKNYQINSADVLSKFTFLYHKDHRFSVFYQFKDKKNVVLGFEKLQQQNLGVSYFHHRNKNSQISAEVNLFVNDFEGDQNSPVSYQMLEGLQTGKNYTWNLIYQQKINSFLQMNITYLGRKSENSNTIHTGSVQLRANF